MPEAIAKAAADTAEEAKERYSCDTAVQAAENRMPKAIANAATEVAEEAKQKYSGDNAV